MSYGNCELCGGSGALIEQLCHRCRNEHGVTGQLLSKERLLTVLSRHIGAARGVAIGDLVDQMMHPKRVDPRDRATLERTARDLVVELRRAGEHVCSHPSSGYFMAANADELDAACKFLFDRAMTSLEQVAAMRRVSLPDLRGQLQLPT